ncbi:1-phosphatidylinositol-3-phosphate 5-kinase [Loxospora ochrophaea]|nr:1-phosphatidylinositol-3-phosphate 5-kinase [Loxospora ochrophaea]
MKLDPAVARALSIDPSKTMVASHGGSGFTTTAKISTTLSDGSAKQFFMKTGRGEDAQVMFEGEHASLNAIHQAVPTLCPASFANGFLEDSPEASFLVTDFLDLTSRSSAESSKLSLAAKLAKLHTTPAPIPEGFERPVFGFPVATCCGDTEQPNTWKSSWADFYAENRLRAILKKSERTNGKDAELRSIVEQIADVVVPRLLGENHLNRGNGITPVVVHGDLWSGNKGKAIIGGKGGVEEVVFDPSACYAHNEYELGIMRMFGGFGVSFMKEYHEICPKTEPVEEYEDRVSLYEA